VLFFVRAAARTCNKEGPCADRREARRSAGVLKPGCSRRRGRMPTAGLENGSRRGPSIAVLREDATALVGLAVTNPTSVLLL